MARTQRETHRALPEDPPGAFERNSTYWNLIQAIRNRQVVLFVGAGISMALRGARSWNQVLTRLAEIARRDIPLPRHYSAYFRAVRAEGDALFTADQWAHYLMSEQAAGTEARDAAFAEAVERSVGGRQANDPAKQRKLAQLLECPFHRIITTNYDGALEEAIRSTSGARVVRRFTNRNIERFADFLARPDEPGRVDLLHLHGHFGAPGSIVLGESQYQRLYSGYAVARALEVIFTTRSVLFLGFSGADDDVMHVIRHALARYPSARERHFLIRGIAPDAKTRTARWVDRIRWNHRYGIGTLDYPAPKGDHTALFDGLVQLASDATGVAEARDAPVPGSRRIAILVDREFPEEGRLVSLIDHLNRVQREIRYVVQAEQPARLRAGFSLGRDEPSMAPAIRWARRREGEFAGAFLYTHKEEKHRYFYAEKKRGGFVSTAYWSEHVARPSLDEYLLHMTVLLTVHFYALRAADGDPARKWLQPHHPDVGCIFDFTERLRNRIAVIDYPRLCRRCAQSLRKSAARGGEFDVVDEAWLRRVTPLVT